MQKQLRIITSRNLGVYELVVLGLLRLPFPVMSSAGIFAGVLFIIMRLPRFMFIRYPVAVIFGAFHQAVVVYLHCPFRGFA